MTQNIIGISVCMLLILTALPVAGKMNVENCKAGNLTASYGLIEIKIDAKVRILDDPYNLLDGVIKVNDTISGKYIYDSGMPDSNPDPKLGSYNFISASCGIELNAGGFVFKTNPSNVNFHIVIENDYPDIVYPMIDEYDVNSYNNLQLSNGMLVDDIQCYLRDANHTIFSNDSLPTHAPDLTQIDYTRLYIGVSEPNNNTKQCWIIATITKLTKKSVIDSYWVKCNWKSNLLTKTYSYKIPEIPLGIKLFERFPHAFPILRQLMGY